MLFLESARKVRFYLERLRLSSWLTVGFVGFALGATLGLAVGGDGSRRLVVFAPTLLVSGCFFVLVIVWKKKVFRYAALTMVFFLLGVSRSLFALPIHSSPEGWYSFTGIVNDFPRLESRGYLHRVDSLEAGGYVGLYSAQRFAYGDRVGVDCNIQKITLEEFQYYQLRSRGIELLCALGANVELVERGANSFFSALSRLKTFADQKIYSSLPSPENVLAAGIILGERPDRSSRLNDVMRTVGISHIVVVSGYNVLVVGEFIFALCFLLGLKRPWAVAGSMIALVAFLFLIGFDASILRAIIMFAALHAAYLLGRPRLGLYTITLTAFVMLAVNPFLIRTLGFLLSFASVAGLSLAGQFWEERLKRLPDNMRPFVVSTLAAQAGALPVVIWYFGSVSTVSLLVNAVVLPLIPFAMGAVIATIALSSLGVPFAGWISYPLLTTVIHVAEWFSRLPFSRFTILSQWNRLFAIGFLVLVYLCVWNRRHIADLFRKPSSPRPPHESEVVEVVIKEDSL